MELVPMYLKEITQELKKLNENIEKEKAGQAFSKTEQTLKTMNKQKAL